MSKQARFIGVHNFSREGDLMNLKQALLNMLTDKQVSLFEKKKRGDRKTDRHYAQLLSAIDELTRTKKHDTSRSKKRRKTHKA